MKVLIGYSCCDVTRNAFRSLGHDAWTCDLLPSRGSQDNHIESDVWDVAKDSSWDMGIFHPMCTYLTVSAAWAFGDGPLPPEGTGGNARWCSEASSEGCRAGELPQASIPAVPLGYREPCTKLCIEGHPTTRPDRPAVRVRGRRKQANGAVAEGSAEAHAHPACAGQDGEWEGAMGKSDRLRTKQAAPGREAVAGEE